MSASHPDPTQLLKDWLDAPEVKAKFQAISDRAIAAVWEDVDLHVPRMQKERENRFALWIEGHENHYINYLNQEFLKEFPGIANHLENPHDLWRMVIQGVWNLISSELIRYAIRGIAFGWVRDRYIETIYPGMPELEGNLWLVPLLQKTDFLSLSQNDFSTIEISSNDFLVRKDVIANIGQIQFDENGNYLEIDAKVPPREPRIRQPRVSTRRVAA